MTTAWVDPDTDRPVLWGIELRYWLVLAVRDHPGPTSIGDLVEALHADGFCVLGRPSKILSDAIRWETTKGRVHRSGHNAYLAGRVPRTTQRRMRRRIATAHTHAVRHDHPHPRLRACLFARSRTPHSHCRWWNNRLFGRPDDVLDLPPLGNTPAPDAANPPTPTTPRGGPHAFLETLTLAITATHTHHGRHHEPAPSRTTARVPSRHAPITRPQVRAAHAGFDSTQIVAGTRPPTSPPTPTPGGADREPAPP